MRVCINSMLRRLLPAAALLLAASAASAKSFLAPFTLSRPTQNQGLWLADIDHLGSPPAQVTNQVLDGPSGQNVAILDTWTTEPITHQAINVQPALLVYGVHGRLYSIGLKALAAPRLFSSGTYGELCSLAALDQRPFAPTRGYVQAVIEPPGSANPCSSGIGQQTWLIRADADATVSPTIQPSNWSVLGAFTNPTTDAFVRWFVWTGNEVNSYNANFTVQTTLLVGPPAGPAPTVLARTGQTAFLLGSSTSGGNQTDTIYRLGATGSSVVGSFTYSTTAPCFGAAGGAVTDPGTGLFSFVEPTNAGYAIYTVPTGGGALAQIYDDSSASACGFVGGDGASAAHVVLNESSLLNGRQRVIGVSETGPSTQAAVVLAGDFSTTNAFAHYTINGHVWIDLRQGSPVMFSELVIDGDGTVVLASYPNSRNGDDIWGSFPTSGRQPIIQRDVVYLFSPSGGLSCNGGTLAAVDPVTFSSVNINGLPADACRTLAYGFRPASVGSLQEPAGSSPIEIDPVAGQLYVLLGPDSTGTFTNLATIPGYPFF